MSTRYSSSLPGTILPVEASSVLILVLEYITTVEYPIFENYDYHLILTQTTRAFIVALVATLVGRSARKCISEKAIEFLDNSQFTHHDQGCK